MPECPTDVDLAKHAAGSLPENRRRTIDNHLGFCERCQEELAEHLSDQDLFLDLAAVVTSNQAEDSFANFGQSEAEFKESLIGRGYEILEEIFRGGQGIVYSAVQIANQRKVAVKRLKLQNEFQPDQIARFHRETDVITRLSHPNIVTVFDNGSVGQCPYLIMELVNGLPLDSYVRQHLRDSNTVITKGSLGATLQLFRKVCDAVSYAHRLGVIHRDLKPNNIIMDHLGEPKILDFGLAKVVEGPIRDLTETGQFLGTLAYASPEQVQYGTEFNIDTRTDVYSLGVVLFELVTGNLPYPVDAGLSNAIQSITEKTPTRPGKYVDRLDNDIETIILKTLAKTPDRRYQTVDELGNDIDRYLAGQPIEAKKDNGLYVLYKSLVQFKGYVLSFAALFAAVSTGLIISIWFWNQAVQQRNLANEATQNESLAREQAELQSYIANIVAAKNGISTNDVAEAKRRLDSAPEKFRGWEFEYLTFRLDQSSKVLQIHELYVSDFELYPEQGIVASIAGDNLLKLWSLDDGMVVNQHQFDAAPNNLAISEDDQWIAVSVDGQEIHLFENETLNPIEVLQMSRQIKQFAFLSDQELLVLKNNRTKKSSLVVWDWSEKTSYKLAANTKDITSFAVCKNKNQVVISGAESGVLDLDSSEFSQFEISEFTNKVVCLELVDQIALFNDANEAIILDDQMKEHVRLKGHQLPINDIKFIDEQTIATASNDRTVRLWDAETGEQIMLLRGHEQPVLKLARIDSNQFLSSANDGTFRIWNTRSTNNPRKWFDHNLAVRKIKFSPDGEMIASCGEDRQAILRDSQTGKVIRSLKHDGALFTLCFSPDGKQLATAGSSRDIRLWNLEDGTFDKLSGHTDRIHSVDFSSDGQRLISGARDKTVRIWNLSNKECIQVLADHDSCVHACVFHPVKNIFATRSHHDIRIWNSKSFEKVHQIEHRISPEDYSLTFDPTGAFLAAGSSIPGFGRGYVSVFDIDSPDTSNSLEQHNSPVNAIGYFPSGHRAISASKESIKIWDLKHFVEMASLELDSAAPYCLAISPDEDSILAGMSNGEIIVWDAN